LTLENLSVIWSFTKTVAEEWFYLIHVVIENHGVEAMKAVKILAENAAQLNSEYAATLDRLTLLNTVKIALKDLASSLKKMNSVLPQMELNCKTN